MTNRVRLLSAALLLLMATASIAQEAVRAVSEPVSASALLGKEVRDPLGERVAVVRDLVLDARHGRVHRVVVETGSARRGYPMHAFSMPSGRSYLVLDRPDAALETPGPRARLVDASSLIGHPFRVGGEARGGRVVDVVLDAFWGKVAFAAARLGNEAALRPLPLDALEPRGRRLALSVNRHDFASLPAFTWEELQSNLRDHDFLRRTARLADDLSPVP